MILLAEVPRASGLGDVGMIYLISQLPVVR